MTTYPYELTPDPDDLVRLGLIVLQVDETIEADLASLLPSGTARLRAARIPSGAELTPETIGHMGAELSRTAALLPDAPFDVIAYGCTSGTVLLGEELVERQVKIGRAARHVTTPLTAAVAAMRHLGIASVAIVSPYIPSVAAPIAAAFEARGVRVPTALSFGEKVERNVARIAPGSIRAAAHEAIAGSGAEALFVSCTNLRTLDIIDRIEADTGVPVLTSNQCLGWHMRALAGLPAMPDAPGRLWRA